MGRKANRSALGAQKGFFGAGCASPLEQLEARRLLSQVNVTSYGAVPNDGRDDLAAIKAAMNASAAGDTIYFPAGTYNLSDTILLKGSRTYLGADGAILSGDPSKHIFHIQQANTTVDNFTFIGKPIMVDTPDGSMVSGMVVNDNTFNMTSAAGDNDSGITFTTGLANSSITNNTFSPIGNHIAIYGYYWNNLTIANNDFLNGGQGLHVADLGNSSQNLLIEQNYFSGLSRMGVEYQGAGTNTIVQDNWYENPVMTSNFHDNDSTFAFSIVADRSTGTIARRNVIWAPQRPDGVGVRIGFETGGDGTLVEDNYIYGINQVLANTDGVGTTSCLAENNYYSQVLDGLVGRGLTQINNGPQVNLQWLIARGRAGPNVRFTDPSNPNGQVVQGQQNQQSQQTTTTPSQPQNSSMTYLSDLTWTSMTNGWGPAEKDHSNGETGANDGHTITIGGQSYAKGLGVHANSEIVYNLNKQYTNFFSDIGVDDEVGNNGSVDFQVWLDGTEVYDSGKVTGAGAAKSISLDVTGKSTLKLVVTNGGDSNGYDHADWANARLQPVSASTSNSSGSGTWLTDLTWSSMSNAWGPAEKDHSNGEMGANDGNILSLRGNTYAKGLGVHANSDIHYNLNGQYSTFASDIGIDNETAGRGSVIFRIYLDGTLIYDSGVVHGTDAIKQVSVNVSGGKDLRLVVNDAGDGNNYDHADWAGAELL